MTVILLDKNQAPYLFARREHRLVHLRESPPGNLQGRIKVRFFLDEGPTPAEERIFEGYGPAIDAVIAWNNAP